MRFLLAGGAGEVGRHMSGLLLDKGHAVTVLDRAAWPAGESRDRLTVIRGDLQDKALVHSAVRSADVVVNLAWSFSDDAATLFREDIGGHLNLMEAAAASSVGRYVYASTAAVYGVPGSEPVTEDQPCQPFRARKPLYAFGKYTAEQLCQLCCDGKGVPFTVLRFWWAFGATVGGKNLRAMIAAAANDEPLQVVGGAGGTFVTIDDLTAAVLAAVRTPAAAGEVYNVGSLFLTWTEIATMIIDTVGARSPLIECSGTAWNGAAFLNECWRLSWGKAARQLGYEPGGNGETIREAFRRALARCAGQVIRGQTDG